MRAPEPGFDLPLRDTRYRELEQYPEFTAATAWLRDYVRSTVPKPRISEREYWSVTCLPAADASERGHRLVSVYAGDLEVACLFLDTRTPGERRLCGFVAVDADSLQRACGADLDTIIADNTELRFRPYDGYWSVGWLDTPACREQFEALPWRGAAADLVSALMRSGRNSSADTHCAQIAMFVFDD